MEKFPSGALTFFRGSISHPVIEQQFDGARVEHMYAGLGLQICAILETAIDAPPDTLSAWRVAEAYTPSLDVFHCNSGCTTPGSRFI
jgi:hypothetical protein